MMNCSEKHDRPRYPYHQVSGPTTPGGSKSTTAQHRPRYPCHQVSGPTKPSTGGSRRREGRRKEGGREGRMRRMRRRRESRLRKNQNIYQGVRKNN
jgi:hypothetical protein